MKILAVCLLLAGLAARVQAVEPRLSGTVPKGGQRGTEMEIKFQGNRLDDAKEILFYSPGFQVTKIEEAKASQVLAKVKIAPDCRLGEHCLRVRTASGVTEIQTFFVGPFPNVLEQEPNNEVAKAQKVPLNSTVEGVVDREDMDCFLVEAKKGQRLSVEVEGVRLGYTLFDPAVVIQDTKGTILAQSDDTALFLQDPAVSILAPQDGTYMIQVRESSYGGSNRCFYRAHIGSFPRPLAVYPAGGKAGETFKAKFIGDPAGDFTQEFKLPAKPEEKYGLVAVRDGVAAPSPDWVRVSPFPNVLEQEPNEALKLATATDLTPPIAFNGIITQKGDQDWFRFKAKKGQTFEINVYAQAIRSPLDSVVNVYNANGGSLAGNDDSGGSDSYVRFSAPADGDYLLRVADHLGRGGADYTYRVELTDVQPSVELSIPHVARFDSQSRQAMVIPRGNRFATLISANRKNTRGDLEFYAESLPPGVALKADVMPRDQSTFPLVFEAAPDAPLGSRLVDLETRVLEKDKDGKVTKKEVAGGHHQIVDLVMAAPNNTVYYQAEVDKLVVAVVEEAPFKIRIVEPKAPIAQYGTKSLKVEVERQKGFDEPINVEFPYRPPGIGANSRTIIPKGATSAEYALNANANAEIRQWKIVMTASAPVKGGTLWVSSQLANLEVAPRFVLGKIETATVQRGQPVKMVCKLDQKVAFEGKASVVLLGLPANTTASPREITKNDKEVVFEVTTTDRSPLGLHKQLFCTITVTKDAEPITHTVAAGGILRIDAPKDKLAENTKGKQIASAVIKKTGK